MGYKEYEVTLPGGLAKALRKGTKEIMQAGKQSGLRVYVTSSYSITQRLWKSHGSLWGAPITGKKAIATFTSLSACASW